MSAEPSTTADDRPGGLRLPELPKLDQRDIDAVRGFLPGKLLGRTGALLALVVMVLAYGGTVDRIVSGWLGSALTRSPG